NSLLYGWKRPIASSTWRKYDFWTPHAQVVDALRLLDQPLTVRISGDAAPGLRRSAHRSPPRRSAAALRGRGRPIEHHAIEARASARHETTFMRLVVERVVIAQRDHMEVVRRATLALVDSERGDDTDEQPRLLADLAVGGLARRLAVFETAFGQCPAQAARAV